MNRIVAIVAIVLTGLSPAAAQECAQEVLIDLYEVLEQIDIAGEKRLSQALDKLSQQEGWSASERDDYTLSLAESPDVDAVESERTQILARLFGLAQRGDQHCLEMRELRAKALAMEEAQWENAVRQVEQRIWH